MEGRRDRSQVFFLLALAVLSALAIWFVEEERPRREQVALSATASVRRATTQGRQTVVARRAALTAAARYRSQIASTATARTNRIANAENRQTATELENVHLTATAVNRSTANAIALNRGATARIRTATAAPRLATSHARQTSAAHGRQTATDHARQTATDRARQTATDRAQQTATDRAVRFATSRARQQATASAQPTHTPTATATATIQPQPAETFYSNPGNPELNANIRTCPRFLQPNPCEIVGQLAYGSAISVVGEVEGDEYLDSTLWKVVEWNGRRLYIHASLLSREPPPALDDAGDGSSG